MYLHTSLRAGKRIRDTIKTRNLYILNILITTLVEEIIKNTINKTKIEVYMETKEITPVVPEDKHAKLMDFLFNQNNINWQTMLYELVKEEGMDIWDVDISKIAGRYVDMVKTLKTLNFHVCGKIILAAAILLKLKSERLLSGDLNNFDALFATDDSAWDELGGIYEGHELRQDLQDLKRQKPLVVPRSPQPRQRKVSIYDLIGALEKALESNARKPSHIHGNNSFEYEPHKKQDISLVIKDVYAKVIEYFQMEQHSAIKFSQIIPEGATKFDKIYTFVPLLHLTNERKIDLMQNEHFGDIEIVLKQRQTTLTLIPQSTHST